jgi:carbon starvation protein
LFGSLNQLLGGLALLVITVYLAHKKVNIIYTVIPMIFMIIMTGWAMFATVMQLYQQQKTLLVCIGFIIIVLEIWIILETIITLYNVYFAPCKKQG